MDFDLTDAQKEVGALAAAIFEGAAKQKPGDATDAALWRELAKAGLIGTALREDVGGAGHGVLEHCALLVAAGAAATRLPLHAITTAAMAVDHVGDAAARAILPAVVRGEALLVPALEEPDGGDPYHPSTRLEAGRLFGVKTVVPAGAAHWVVSTTTGLALVDAKAAAAHVRIEAQTATTGAPHVQLTFDGAPAAPLGDASARDWLLDRATVGLCAMELGVAGAVLKMTAAYTSQRVQFDRPIATFQAVAQRAADAYIDVETLRVTTWEAAWQLAEGRPAARAIAIAKTFAAEAGARVAYAAQHLHGGVGFDLEYGLARYYPLSRWLELGLGGAGAQLARLGAMLAVG